MYISRERVNFGVIRISNVNSMNIVVFAEQEIQGTLMLERL